MISVMIVILKIAQLGDAPGDFSKFMKLWKVSIKNMHGHFKLGILPTGNPFQGYPHPTNVTNKTAINFLDMVFKFLCFGSENERKSYFKILTSRNNWLILYL